MTEGAIVGSYVHSNNKIAVLVSLRGGDEAWQKMLQCMLLQ